jgi:D-alanyl-D-alanine carboxypeptidase
VAAALAAPDRIEPDSAHRYCNTDYVLLGLVVESATGQRVEAQLWQRIFQPLRLHDTTFPTVDPHVRGPHAQGHVRLNAGMSYLELTALSPSQSWTAGAIVSTPGDVARFFDALFTGELLDDKSLARMTDCSEPLDDRCARGLGIVRYAYEDGNVLFGDHGGLPGFTTLALRSTTGRTFVLYQNGFDMHRVLTSDNPFVKEAVVV